MLQAHCVFCRVKEETRLDHHARLTEKLTRLGLVNRDYANGVGFAGSSDLVFNVLQEEWKGDGDALQAAAIGPWADGMELTPPLTFYPVGVVQRPFDAAPAAEDVLPTDAVIAIDVAFEAAIQGMVSGDRYLVLYCFHQSTGFQLRQHPRGDTLREERGVFALRSPHRPNAIGATEVELVAIEGCVLVVRGLDAIDGSPVLDIKPVRQGTSL